MLYLSHMNPQKQSVAKDVFSYLLMIIMLYVGVVSFSAMIWQYINVGFPDLLNGSYGAYDIIRNSISALAIVWPVFIFLSWMIGKDLRAIPEKKELRVRKWLLYLTLFIASIVIIVDLIQLLNSFLSGEITMRFVLKVLVILVVAVAVFGYFLWDLKRDPLQKSMVSKQVAIVTVVVILGSIISGFFLVGSPMHQRDIRMDDQRVSDLQNIQSQILNFWTQKGSIPKTLDDLKDPLNGFVAPVDPISKQPYEYIVKGEHDFELCATFTNASGTEQSNRYKTVPMMYPVGNGTLDIWTHSSGHSCFTRSIDPELYRPVPKDAIKK